MSDARSVTISSPDPSIKGRRADRWMNQWVFCFATTVTTKRNPSVPLCRPQYLQWNSSSRVCVCDASSSSSSVLRMGGGGAFAKWPRKRRKGSLGRSLLRLLGRRSLTLSSSSSSSLPPNQVQTLRSRKDMGGRRRRRRRSVYLASSITYGANPPPPSYIWWKRRDTSPPPPPPHCIPQPHMDWTGGGGRGGRRGRQRNRETKELKSKEVTCTITRS